MLQRGHPEEEDFDEPPPERRPPQNRQEPEYDFDDDLPPDLEDSRPSRKNDHDASTPALPGTFVLPTSAEQPKVFVLAGACASGKTFMLKSCMYRFAQAKHFKFGVTFTATGFTGDYDWAPERSIREWDEEFFKAYINEPEEEG